MLNDESTISKDEKACVNMYSEKQAKSDLQYAKEINQIFAKDILKKVYGIDSINENINSVKLLEEMKLKKVEILGEERSLRLDEILDILF